MRSIRTLIAAALLGAAAQIASAAELPGPLVDAQWLHAHLNEVVVIDVRDDAKSFSTAPQFETDKTGKKHLVETGGHIAGAIAVDFGKIRETREVNGVKIKSQLPSAAFFTEAMAAAGLNRGDKPIVIVSTGEGISEMDMATRLYFQLRYFGEPRGKLAVLNGGVNGWIQSGFPVSTDKPAPARGNWTAGKEDASILATIDQVKSDLGRQGVQFVDARPTAQYLGIVTKSSNKSGGHLAGARSLPTDAVVRQVGAATEFLSADEYRRIYAAYGIQPKATTVSYCNTGHLASGAWFVNHEIVGNPASRLYAGSMIEWTNLGNPTVGLKD